MNNNIKLLLEPLTTNYLPKGTKLLRSLIVLDILKSDWYDDWNVFARHCKNGILQVQVIDFDQSYITIYHTELFCINNYTVAIIRLTDRVLYVSNDLKTTNVPSGERVYIIPPPY